jgi:hypothetical protein
MKIRVGTRYVLGWLDLTKNIIVDASNGWEIWKSYSLADFCRNYQDKRYPIKIYTEDSMKQFPPYYTVDQFLPMVQPQEPAQETTNADLRTTKSN